MLPWGETIANTYRAFAMYQTLAHRSKTSQHLDEVGTLIIRVTALSGLPETVPASARCPGIEGGSRGLINYFPSVTHEETEAQLNSRASPQVVK